MSKKFKGRLCVYCAEAESTTADHVIARQFFLPTHRSDLPQAPACNLCNNEKSRLEHYVTSLLPFGGRHPDAEVNLQTMVPKRLQKNAKLHRTLVQECGTAWSEERAGLLVPVMTVPLDSSRLVRLFALMAKGLALVEIRSRSPKSVTAEPGGLSVCTRLYTVQISSPATETWSTTVP